MPRSMDHPLHIARRALHRADGWCMFVQVALRNGTFVRLVEDDKHRLLDGVWWQRAAFKLDGIVDAVASEAPRLSFNISNVSRVPLAYVELYGEVLGCVLSVAYVHDDETEINPTRLWRHRVTLAVFDYVTARFECGHRAGDVDVPGRIYTRENTPSIPPSAGVRL